MERQCGGGGSFRFRRRTRLPAAAGGAMTFADLVAGDALFVDANTLTYHFQPHPIWGPACSDLLQRIENREIAGCTSTHVLSEVVGQPFQADALCSTSLNLENSGQARKPD